MHQLLRHRYHAAHALGIHGHFFFGLGDIELGSRQEARCDEFEAEFLVVFGLGGYKALNNLDIKICKPNHYCHIHEIERGVEYRQAKRYAHLHHGYLVQHVVAGGKRVVEQVVVELGIGFLEGVDKVEQVVGIALADYLGEPGVELGKGTNTARHQIVPSRLKSRWPMAVRFAATFPLIEARMGVMVVPILEPSTTAQARS